MGDESGARVTLDWQRRGPSRPNFAGVAILALILEEFGIARVLEGRGVLRGFSRDEHPPARGGVDWLFPGHEGT